MAPYYKTDLAKEYELEQGQKFFREKLSGKVAFIGSDYDFIASKEFDHEYFMFIHKSTDDGATWNPTYFKGKFMKTDCEWDADNKKVSVKVDPLDDYTDVIGGLEKEYNLIELAPAMTSVSYRKRVFNQIYIQGDNVIGCVNENVYWEQPCDEIHDYNELRDKFHFGTGSLYGALTVVPTFSDTYNISGTYVGSNSFSRSDKDKAFEIIWITLSDRKSTQFIIKNSKTGEHLFNSQIFGDGNPPNGTIFFKSIKDPTSLIGYQCFLHEWRSDYSRKLVDRKIGGRFPTYPLPSDDMAGYNPNYRFAKTSGYPVLVMSGEVTSEPTIYGKRGDGKYYIPPYSDKGIVYTPILRHRWDIASLWVDLQNISSEDAKLSVPTTLKECYGIADSIQALLKEFAPNVKHEAKPEYSEFLYGKNPISNEPFRLSIIQKSNVLSGRYDQAATVATTTLMSLLNMLRDCFRCYWFIEDGKLKIEHVEWFRNGGSYTDKHEIAEDLTKIKNPKNGKPWDFGKSQWSFDKEEMPERFKFEWMDKTSKSFDGYPIDIVSKYVQLGKIEDVNVAQFTTDVDFMVMSPNEISKDGFALFGAINEDAIPTDGGKKVFNQGYINESGVIKVGTSQSEEGYGWKYTKCDVLSGNTYTLYSVKDVKMEKTVYWQFYDEDGRSIGRASHSNATVLIPDNCKTLGLCFKIQSVARPSAPELKVIQSGEIGGLLCSELSLPLHKMFIGKDEYTFQNGYLSWMYLHDKF
ncbi:MAG: hypothetical protein ACRCZZ_01405, partial [Phocaeicola sp.]